jgi:hypothetical protein
MRRRYFIKCYRQGRLAPSLSLWRPTILYVTSRTAEGERRKEQERETCNIWEQTYFRLVNFDQPEVDGRIDLSRAWAINLRCLGGEGDILCLFNMSNFVFTRFLVDFTSLLTACIWNFGHYFCNLL